MTEKANTIFIIDASENITYPVFAKWVHAFVILQLTEKSAEFVLCIWPAELNSNATSSKCITPKYTKTSNKK